MAEHASELIDKWNVPFAVVGAVAVIHWLTQMFEYGEGLADLSSVETLELVVAFIATRKIVGSGRRAGVDWRRTALDLFAALGVVSGLAFCVAKLCGSNLSAPWLAVSLLAPLALIAKWDLLQERERE